MERHMQQYDKEYLKMAFLNQEATFRQQVHELHRVYQVQQILMGEVNTNKKKIQMEMSAEEFGLELTLATGSSSSSRSHQKKKESSSCSDSGSSFSSSSTGSGGTKQQFPIPEIDARFKHEMHSRFEMEERTRKDWFSQCLSPNMT